MPRKTKKIARRTVAPQRAAKFNNKILVKVLIAVLLLGLIYLLARTLLVASVNGQLIGRFTVIRELEKQSGKSALDTIILKTLINQEAKKRNVSVSQKDVDDQIKKIEANVASQGSTLDVLLEQQGMKKKDLVEEIRLQLLVTKMVGENVSVSDQEIDSYMASQSEQLAANPSQQLTRDQVKAQLKQQKLQQKIQAFVSDLRAKAKITYFINY